MDKKLKFGAEDVKDIVKCTLIAVVSCLALVLIFAIIAKFANFGENVIKPINITIKGISVLIGVLIGIKNINIGAVKGLITAVLFILSTYILFSIVNQDWAFDKTMLIDTIILIVDGLASGVIAVNIKDRKSGRR